MYRMYMYVLTCVNINTYVNVYLCISLHMYKDMFICIYTHNPGTGSVWVWQLSSLCSQSHSSRDVRNAFFSWSIP